MKARHLAWPLLLALPALLAAQYKPWYNHYNFAYGAKARAMGNAFTAVADDLTAAFWNPAGLALQRSPEFYLGYRNSSQQHGYDLQSRELGNEVRLYNYDFASTLNQIDFFSVSAPATLWKQPWTFALSYYRYIPYGFKGTAREVLTSKQDRAIPRLSTVIFRGSEGLDVLAFSTAAALGKHIAVGCTLQQFFGSGSQDLGLVNPDGEFHSQYIESLQGRNLIAGLLISPFTFLRLGFTWHSGLRNRFGSTLLTWEVDAKGERINPHEKDSLARVVIPGQYALGALLQPLRWLDLSAEFSTLDWGKGSIENYFAAGTVLPYPQKGDWKQKQNNVRNARLGVEARMPLRRWQLHLRGGWAAERQLYFDAADRPVTVRTFSAGAGCEFSRNLLLEIAFQRQQADWPEQGFYFKAPDVASHFHAHEFNLALTYRFGDMFKE